MKIRSPLVETMIWIVGPLPHFGTLRTHGIGRILPHPERRHPTGILSDPRDLVVSTN